MGRVANRLVLKKIFVYFLANKIFFIEELRRVRIPHAHNGFFEEKMYRICGGL